MAVLRTARPYWLDRTTHDPVVRYPTLCRELRTDVVIVGGGITGATIAWTLANDGLSVVVLEALRIAKGSTAASTALLMQEPDEDVMGLTRRYGPTRARRIWELSRQASDDFIALLRSLRIGCELAERDSIYFTRDQHEQLRREHHLRTRARLGGRWLNAEALRAITGIRGSAIRTTGNAQADPYQACLGLVSRSAENGVRIFEQTPALRVNRHGGEMIVSTPGGQVRAETVVIATGFATPQFRPLCARFRMRHTYVVVTAPLSARTRRELGLADAMLWDTDRPYHYARWTNDHRLMLGGGDRPQTRGSRRRQAFRKGTAHVRDFFVGVYPELATVGVDYAWEGLFATTPDGLPYVGPHRRYPGHLFALGYGGNGMTFSMLAARLIRERLAGQVTDDHDLFSFGRMRRGH